MTTRIIAVSLVLLASLAAISQKSSRPDVSDFPLFIGPKNERLERIAPGLNATLLLTDDQKTQLITARRETLDSEETRAASASLKNDPALSDAQKTTIREKLDASRKRFSQRVGDVLTAENKALISRVTALYSTLARQVAAEYLPHFADAKGKDEESARIRQEAQQKLKDEFGRSLVDNLTDAQRAAMASAAAEEARRAAEAAAKKKKP